MEKICPVCHKIFEARGKHHIYCSVHCRKVHHKMVYYDRNRVTNYEDNSNNKVIRTFVCQKCSKLVIVTSENDKRTKFCCPHCEKLYWKHPQKYKIIEALKRACE